MGEVAKAEQYEALYPDAVQDEGQKAERWDRMLFKSERREHRRSARNRGIVVPELPYQEVDR